MRYNPTDDQAIASSSPILSVALTKLSTLPQGQFKAAKEILKKGYDTLEQAERDRCNNLVSFGDLTTRIAENFKAGMDLPDDFASIPAVEVLKALANMA